MANSSAHHSPTRRDVLRNMAMTSGAAALAGRNAAEGSSTSDGASSSQHRPNVLMIRADPCRVDFAGASHKLPSVKTPHIDALGARETNFRKCISHQPLCPPSHAWFLAWRYATEAAVRKLGLELDHSPPTIATELRKNGYTSHFMGKRHVSRTGWGDGKKPLGWIPSGPSRDGFNDQWEGAGVPELLTRPSEGSDSDNHAKNIGRKDKYRVDFIANRDVEFNERDRRWLHLLPQLDPRHKNDMDSVVPQSRYADAYSSLVYHSQFGAQQRKNFDSLYHPPRLNDADSHLPENLRNVPGNWSSRIPGSHGFMQGIEDCALSLVVALERTGQLGDTMIVFSSEHGWTFRARSGEYKRPPREGSIRVPFVITRPGFEQSAVSDEVVTQLDLTSTLLDGASIQPPRSMHGRRLKQRTNDQKARETWDSTAYFQMSQSTCGPGICTCDGCYCAFDPAVIDGKAEYGKQYQDFAPHSIACDPAEMVILAGRAEYKDIGHRLRGEPQRGMVAAGEPEITMMPVLYYDSRATNSGILRGFG